MYVAMNRFRVNAGFEEGFEALWSRRDRYLEDVPGFLGFRLLRGEAAEGITPFISHSKWATKSAFVAWTKSDAFRKAHGDARSPEGTLAGHPEFSGFDVILDETP